MGLGTHKLGIGLIGPFVGSAGDSLWFQWFNGRQFFHLSTPSIKKLLQCQEKVWFGGLQRWQMAFRAVPSDRLVWDNIWKKYREDKNIFFLVAIGSSFV